MPRILVVVAATAAAALFLLSWFLTSAVQGQTLDRHALNGPYVGVFGGHMQTAATIRFSRDDEWAGQINDTGGNTFFGGAMVGWSRATPSGLFVGVEATASLPAEPYPTTIVQYADVDYVVSNRGEAGGYVRLGAAVGQNAAIYFRGGVALGNVDYRLNGASNPRVLWYPQVGAGAEIALDQRWALRGDMTFDRIALDLGDVDVRHQVRWRVSAGLSYRF